MLKTTADTFPDREIEETLGLVVSNAVRARHVGRDILAGLKNLVGGEIGAYRHLLIESREQALAELEAKSAERGADAVVLQPDPLKENAPSSPSSSPSSSASTSSSGAGSPARRSMSVSRSPGS